jgi:hypothetical protein
VLLCFWCVHMRSSRSLPNSEMALAPAFIIILVLVSLFAVGGYWLMKPTVLKNPGVAAYQPPAAAKVLDNNSEAKLIAAEAAATAAADKENRKLGLAANAAVAPRASIGTRSADGRAVEGPATPKQTTARVQKRQDAPGQAPRVAQRESAPSLFGLFRLF